MAASFLCQITGLGSRNTPTTISGSSNPWESWRSGREGREGPQEQHLCLSGRGPQLEAPPHGETRHRPLGCPCPVPQGERGTEAEIEELQAELARHMNGGAIAHPELSNGDGVPHQEQPPHSYETAYPGGSSEESGPIAHPELSNGPETAPTQEASHSYETAGSGGSPRESIPIAHSELSNGAGEGQEYLSRRDRVESLVMRHRTYYDRSFHRRGVLGAIEYFSPLR